MNNKEKQKIIDDFINRDCEECEYRSEECHTRGCILEERFIEMTIEHYPKDFKRLKKAEELIQDIRDSIYHINSDLHLRIEKFVKEKK